MSSVYHDEITSHHISRPVILKINGLASDIVKNQKYKYMICNFQVNITKDSSEGKETDAILDQCLQNRAWVLQVHMEIDL